MDILAKLLENSGFLMVGALFILLAVFRKGETKWL